MLHSLQPCCHDGVERETVTWSAPAPIQGPLDFAHDVHAEEVALEGEPPVECASCHIDEDGESMALVPLDAARCLDCHETGSGSDHYAQGTDCAECHRTVAEVDHGDVRMADYPKPNLLHTGRFFLLEGHGGEAIEALSRCSTCHVEDQCASCHVDATLDPIPSMPSAPASWETPTIEPNYPMPTGHDEPSYQRTHGRPEPGIQDCSTCHTQNDCAACHLTPLPNVAQELPERPQVRAPGAGLTDRLPASHDSPFFASIHSVLSATAPDSCATCHTESYCSDCHNAPDSPGYHPPSFALRHSAAVGSQAAECSTCHNPAAFCRTCHAELGVRSAGRLGSGFHDAEPVWLLRHGAAARQGLEQCASCHTQQSCLQCHSTLGAFKVSPHGPDFDPGRAQDKNPWICKACHIGAIG